MSDDARYLISSVGAVFPRWPLVTALLALLHRLFPEVPAAALVAYSGLIAVLSSAVLITWLWPNWGLPLVITTPLWQAFMSTHVTSYAAIMVAAYAVIIAWVVAYPLRNHNAIAWGAVAGFLPLIHIELVPVSLILLGLYVLGKARRGCLAMIMALATWGIMITLCFGSPRLYIVALWPLLNLGETNTLYGPYVGLAQPGSVFFKLNYAFSAAHLREVWAWYLRASGVTMAFALPLCAAMSWRSVDSRMVVAFCLVLWAILFHILMLPKQGPVADWDLFWMPVVTLPLCSGAGRDGPRRLDVAA